MKNELKNINFLESEFKNHVDHEYTAHYLRVNSKGLTCGNVKQFDDNIEIIFDHVKKEIISIKIIG